MGLLLLVIVLSGLAGGLASYLVRDQTDVSSTGAQQATTLLGALLAGVVASFCVPLFLLLTQSKLLEGLLDDAIKTDQKGLLQYDLDLLYTAGFCLIAAYSARAFLQSISSKILHEVQEAKQESKIAKEQSAEAKQLITETSNKVQTAEQDIHRVGEIAKASVEGVRDVAQQTETVAARADTLTEAIENLRLDQAPAFEEEAHITEDMEASAVDGMPELSGPEIAVLASLDNPTYQFRTTGRMSAESGVPLAELSPILQRLRDYRLIRSTTGRTGVELYTLTHLGRLALNAARNRP
jgi:hypothetical protein